jgi:uncharacterized membrane protein
MSNQKQKSDEYTFEGVMLLAGFLISFLSMLFGAVAGAICGVGLMLTGTLLWGLMRIAKAIEISSRPSSFPTPKTSEGTSLDETP